VPLFFPSGFSRITPIHGPFSKSVVPTNATFPVLPPALTRSPTLNVSKLSASETACSSEDVPKIKLYFFV
jgi:hypothetical protein